MVSLEKNDRVMLARQLPLKSVALILAGGRGTRLKDLTNKRAKPAVHFGGKFRIIDFALSNCLNSGIRRIGVITQYQSHTLVQHIQRGWSLFSEEMNEFVDLLPAQQRMKGENWYRGTADAVTQNLDIIRRYKAEYVVILAGDHIYKQDYSRMLIDHVEKGARCTVACMPVPIKEATAFGVMAVDESDKIIDFVEKPANPPQCLVTPANRWPVWAFTFLTPITCMNCWRQTIKMTLPATISVKTLSPKSPAKVWLTRILSRSPACSPIRKPNRTGAM
ncbi:Glucose-1-phosphate adenylyltransferase [Salmonella enterica subsp. enterica]|uniref:Glucose-1-phosphate adenylyltransferase n=1 Tax=Salmonella enterica I TaxID=59201 RepID=A0A447N2L1_SALET|nr:Glucose-1-phosphate adenylyltransferase [Salmonella enterica subsp. enterica]